MQFLIIVLVVILMLLGLYLAAHRVAALGLGFAFVCLVLSRVLIRISEFASRVAMYCHKACLASLSYPPDESEYWPVVKVFSRVVYFILAVLLLGGEIFNTLLAIPVLFHTVSRFQLPNVVELSSAALFICTPALLGAVILECIGLIPYGAGLFPSMSKPIRIGLGALTGIFLVLATLLTGYFYLYRAAFLLDPESAQEMSLYILGGLGLSIAAVSVLALWALVVGGCGVASVVLWIIGQICRVVVALASIVPSVLDILAVHLSQGVLSVHGEYIGHDPYKVASPLFRAPEEVSHRLPERASKVDVVVSEAEPVENSLEETPVNNPGKNASLVFVGSFGTRMFVPIVGRIARINASGSILSSSYLDLRGVASNQKSIGGVRDLSPSYTLIKNAMLDGGEEKAYETLLSGLSASLVETHLDLKAVPAPFVYFVDFSLLSNMAELLVANKRRLPWVSQLVVTSLSSTRAKNPDAQKGLRAMQKLHSEGDIATLVVLDPLSPFAALHSENAQLTFFAHMVVSLIVANRQSGRNQSFSNLLRDMHSVSPFTSVSFDSQVVAIGDVPRRLSWLPGLHGKTGSGNYDDLVTQSREAIHRVLYDTDTRAYPSSIDDKQPAKVLLTVPMALNDDRFPRLIRDIALYVGQSYPYAASTIVCANGCTYPHHVGGRFVVQASALYPLHHLVLPALQNGKTAKVTSLYPLESAVDTTNAHGLLNSGKSSALSGNSAKTDNRQSATPRATRRKATSK